MGHASGFDYCCWALRLKLPPCRCLKIASGALLLQPLPQPLVVEEREGELDSEALDRFKAEDKEGRGAWQLQVSSGAG